MIDWQNYKNFSKHEFDCNHTGKNEMKPEFLAVLQQIRNVWGKPMVINSGYRHWTHPIERAKENPGEHSLGLAADIGIRGLSNVLTLANIAELHGIKRIGIYQNNAYGYFMHFGMGDKAHRYPEALWTK